MTANLRVLISWNRFRGWQQRFTTNSYEGQVEELNLEKRLLRRDSTAIFRYVRGYHTEEGDSLFSVTSKGRTSQWVGTTGKYRRFSLDRKRNFSAVRAAWHWNSLHTTVVDSHALKSFKQRLNGRLSGML